MSNFHSGIDCYPSRRLLAGASVAASSVLARLNVRSLPGAPGEHPCLKVTLQEAPQPPLAFPNGERGKIAFTCPSGHGAAVDTAKEFGCLNGRQKSVATDSGFSVIQEPGFHGKPFAFLDLRMRLLEVWQKRHRMM